jgi:hypothetical protein
MPPNSGNRSATSGCRFVGKAQDEMKNQDNLARNTAKALFDAVSASIDQRSGWNLQNSNNVWLLVERGTQGVYQVFEIRWRGSEIELWGDQTADGSPVCLATAPVESFSSEWDVWKFLEKADPKIRSAKLEKLG